MGYSSIIILYVAFGIWICGVHAAHALHVINQRWRPFLVIDSISWKSWTVVLFTDRKIQSAALFSRATQLRSSKVISKQSGSGLPHECEGNKCRKESHAVDSLPWTAPPLSPRRLHSPISSPFQTSLLFLRGKVAFRTLESSTFWTTAHSPSVTQRSCPFRT